MLGGVAQGLTQTRNYRIQVVLEIDENVVLPKLPSKILARDNLPRTFKQRSQHLEGLFSKLDVHSALAELAGVQIGFVGIEADDMGHRPARGMLARHIALPLLRAG